ncbi:unnamed protein product [Leptosia nina]|uniref:TROVE domain-containing protein n=1 Tax=Leptosia nina TaxID=320188 RepID=A0AAV1JI23_9NEOP
MTESTALDPKLRNRFTRYLHNGTEQPIYYPGCWTSHKYFEADGLPVLSEIFRIQPNNTEVVKIIVKAYENGWYTRYETIAFALAKCVKLGSNPVKEASYKAAAIVCKAPEELMAFNKFTRFLETGNGQGWCNHLRLWYNSKEPMELAKEITRVKARHGRSHKILLTKSHIKIAGDDFARDAIVKYAIFGLKRTKQIVGETSMTKPIFDYIQKVEDVRHCEDPVAAAALIEENQFTLDHVPGHLLISQEVWNAILPQFTLQQLLLNIQRIHNMAFLTEDSTTTAILCSLLTNKDKIKASKITPIEVYITLCNYQNSSRPLKHQKAKVALEKLERRRQRQVFNREKKIWEWNVTRRHPKEAKHWGIDQLPNQAIITALQNLINESWKLTPPTKARYLITLDMRDHMFKGRHFCERSIALKKLKKTESNAVSNGGGGDADNAQASQPTTTTPSKTKPNAECFYNKNVIPGYAAIIVMLQLLKREKQVKVAVFTEQGVDIIDTRKCTNIEGTERYLRKAKLGRVQMDAPIEWANKMNEKFDVFINMIDRPSRYLELDVSLRGGRGPGGRFGPPPAQVKELADHCPVRALERYRVKAEKPEAKLIVMSLASHRVGTSDGSHQGVLDIVGIDEHVPKVMDAFVLGQFQ